MDDNTRASETVAPKKKKLSHAEQKIADRQAKQIEMVNKAASGVRNKLCNKFFDFFLNVTDPEDPQVDQMVAIVNAQWRVYCKQMRFQPVAFSALSDYCKNIIAEYKIEKYGPPPVAPKPEVAPPTDVKD